MNKVLAASFGSLTEGVYALLRRSLLSGRIGPGERLKIGELVERYGVSQGAVREALARLTADGLIETEPQRGFRAKSISAEELRDLTTVRVNVEDECLRRSVTSGDLQWEKRLVGAYHEMTRTPPRWLNEGESNEDFGFAHLEFHEALVSGCSCGWLLQLRRTLHAQSERAINIIQIRPDRPRHRDVDAEHRALLDAALARDADQLARISRAHLEVTTERLLDLNTA